MRYELKSSTRLLTLHANSANILSMTTNRELRQNNESEIVYKPTIESGIFEKSGPAPYESLSRVTVHTEEEKDMWAAINPAIPVKLIPAPLENLVSLEDTSNKLRNESI
jgi:hypothetical protein